MELLKKDNLEARQAELASLERALIESWSVDTSSVPDKWSKRNPALGQCAVTALVVQDHFGGKLVRVEVLNKSSPSRSHYKNELPDGSIVDLTLRQFSGGALFGEKAYRERAYVLSFPETVSRYALLKTRVNAAFKKQSLSSEVRK